MRSPAMASTPRARPRSPPALDPARSGGGAWGGFPRAPRPRRHVRSFRPKPLLGGAAVHPAAGGQAGRSSPPRGAGRGAASRARKYGPGGEGCAALSASRRLPLPLLLAMTVGAPSRTAVVVCGVLSGLLLVSGLVLIVILPAVIRNEVAKTVRIQPNTSFYNLWKDIPFPFYFSIYLFEVLNPDEVLDGGKPAVQQRGPYVYREYREKRNITFHENGTVSFLEYRFFHFQPTMSNGTDNDHITIPNLLVLGAAVMLENALAPVQIAVSTVFSFFKQKAFLNRTVAEILWGYEDPIVKILNTIKPGFFPFGNKFGILVDFNDSHSGWFTVNTGVDDISKVHMVDTWNGLKKVSYWRSDQCNQINGTNGEIWPPFITPSTPIELYNTDACRSMHLQFKDEGEFQNVPVYRYVAPKTLFANGTDYPPNEGFCPCRQSGIQNMSSCRLNIPLFLSQPHFYNADPELLETVDGLHPSEKKHGLFVELHPLTGVPLNVSVKMQLNLFIKRVRLISQTRHIKPVVLPILWFDEHGMITDDVLDPLYDLVVLVPTILGYLQYCVVGLGGILLLVTAFLWFRSKETAPQTDPPTSGLQEPASTPLLQKDLTPNVHGDD